MPNLTIPNNETDPYICYDLLLPSDTTYSITSYDAVINTTGGSQATYVHHQLLYNCSGRPGTFGKGPYNCNSMGSGCNVITLEAASKEGTLTYPPEAGFRMGQGGMTYVVLQVHYNNMVRDSPIDNSGFRIHFTRQLTRYDIGVLVLGWEFFSIPKQSMGWSQGDSVCPSSCTNKFNGPLKVVRNFLHMHRLGSSMITRHARQDEDTGEWNELRPLASLSYYDFNFQAGDKEVHASIILPGDALIARCTWDNPYPKSVNFGRATNDEMCYSYVHVYPMQNLNGISKCTNIGRGFEQSFGLATCYDENLADQESLISRATPRAGSSLVQSVVEFIMKSPEMFVQGQSYIASILNPFVPTLPPVCASI